MCTLTITTKLCFLYFKKAQSGWVFCHLSLCELSETFKTRLKLKLSEYLPHRYERYVFRKLNTHTHFPPYIPAISAIEIRFHLLQRQSSFFTWHSLMKLLNVERALQWNERFLQASSPAPAACLSALPSSCLSAAQRSLVSLRLSSDHYSDFLCSPPTLRLRICSC